MASKGTKLWDVAKKLVKLCDFRKRVEAIECDGMEVILLFDFIQMSLSCEMDPFPISQNLIGGCHCSGDQVLPFQFHGKSKVQRRLHRQNQQFWRMTLQRKCVGGRHVLSWDSQFNPSLAPCAWALEDPTSLCYSSPSVGCGQTIIVRAQVL